MFNNDPALTALLETPPDPLRPYVYRGTRSRINKFGILNPVALDSVVRTLSGLRGQLLPTAGIELTFDLKHLCAIHGYLFQDVFDWAGKVRIVDFNKDPIVEGTERVLPFVEPEVIVEQSNALFDKLAAEQWLEGLEAMQFTERVAFYLQELYRIHPFRDGNGRTLREFFTSLCAARGYTFELSDAPQRDRHWTAIEAHRGNMQPLQALLSKVVKPLSHD